MAQTSSNLNKLNVKTNNLKFLIYIFPIITMLMGVIYIFNMYPIHVNSGGAFGQDPAYQYLFAGLDILQGNSPVHTDHPGTPVQSLIAITIALTWAVMKVAGFEYKNLFDSVLMHPEWYLASSSSVFLVLNVISNYFVGYNVYKTSQKIAFALIAQSMPLVFGLATVYMVYPTPEALLWCISFTLVGVMVPFVLNNKLKKQCSNRTPIYMAGILCGLGLAVKVTFIPMFGLLLLIGNWRLIFKALIVAVLSWMIGVLPILQRLPKMFEWFYTVLTHSGMHGKGNSAIISFQQIKQNISWLIAIFPLFYWIMYGLLIFSTILILYKLAIKTKIINTNLYIQNKLINTESIDVTFLVPILILLVAFLQTIMVAKHPGVTYMIPALPLATLGLLWILHTSDVYIKNKFICRMLYISLLILFIVNIFYSSLDAYNRVRQEHDRGLSDIELINKEIKKYNNPILIGTFNCNYELCATWFGMSLVPDIKQRMTNINPDFYYYDIFSKTIHSPKDAELSSEQSIKLINDFIANEKTVLLISPQYDQLNKFKMEKIVNGKLESLFNIQSMQ